MFEKLIISTAQETQQTSTLLKETKECSHHFQMQGNIKVCISCGVLGETEFEDFQISSLPAQRSNQHYFIPIHDKELLRMMKVNAFEDMCL